jgi:hypothetical protein
MIVSPVELASSSRLASRRILGPSHSVLSTEFLTVAVGMPGVVGVAAVVGVADRKEPGDAASSLSPVETIPGLEKRRLNCINSYMFTRF